ncbi:hypothetical protein [Burkholderia pseudomallei]|uniref:hypothetical protein n=1 Tax=Burkholderia pseudomallei TaxID=28450 RepID=UPI00105DBF20|nr:hypothetical protein [Burkholderia pseudomallei]
MSNTKFAAVVLNGPAKSGKDTILNRIAMQQAQKGNVMVIGMEFKEALIDFAVRTAGISRKLWDALYEREYKELPTPYLQINGENVSPRQWLIHISESVVKPMLGEDFFGKVVAGKIKNQMEAVSDLGYEYVFFVFSDGGFPSEALPIIELLGRENYFVSRLHRYDENGDEYTFDGDSRMYLMPEFFQEAVRPFIFDVINREGGQGTCAATVMSIVKEQLEEGNK